MIPLIWWTILSISSAFYLPPSGVIWFDRSMVNYQYKADWNNNQLATKLNSLLLNIEHWKCWKPNQNRDHQIINAAVCSLKVLPTGLSTRRALVFPAPWQSRLIYIKNFRYLNSLWKNILHFKISCLFRSILYK